MAAAMDLITDSSDDNTRSCPRGHWRPAEDENLRRLVEQYGPHNWNSIAEKLQGRSGKSCRLRWFNQLDPRINRRPFTEEEEERLLAAHRIHGNKWALISRLFPGRTDNAVKNHWHVVMARKQREQLKLCGKRNHQDVYRNSNSSNIFQSKFSKFQESYRSRIGLGTSSHCFDLQSPNKEGGFSVSWNSMRPNTCAAKYSSGPADLIGREGSNHFNSSLYCCTRENNNHQNQYIFRDYLNSSILGSCENSSAVAFPHSSYSLIAHSDETSYSDKVKMKIEQHKEQESADHNDTTAFIDFLGVGISS